MLKTITSNNSSIIRIEIFISIPPGGLYHTVLQVFSGSIATTEQLLQQVCHFFRKCV